MSREETDAVISLCMSLLSGQAAEMLVLAAIVDDPELADHIEALADSRMAVVAEWSRMNGDEDD